MENKMKKIISVILFAVIILVFGVLFVYLWPKVKIETLENNSVDLSEIFANEGHYYVYFYKER